MLWMGIWGHPCTVTPLQFWVNVSKIGVGLSPSDVVMSWLRLKAPMYCIPHPYHMYTKYFNPLICCEWTYGSPLHCYAYAGRGWWIFGNLGCGWVCAMLQCHGWGSKPPWIASHIHIICIQIVLAPWYAVDGHMGAHFTLLRLCNFRKIGVGLSPSDVVMSWLRLQTPVDCIPHLYHMYTNVLAPWYAVDGHMGAPLHCYAFAGRGEF